MSITIDEPQLESWLAQEAAKRGLTPDEYLRHLLELHLLVPAARQDETALPHTPEEGAAMPEGSAVAADAWIPTFNGWVDSHPRREAMPPEAFMRASFYPEPA